MAAQDRSVRDSVCLNHPDRPATARCTVCFKPVCAECLIRNDDGGFCSETCAANYARTRGSLDAWHEQRRREAAVRRRRMLVRLAVLVCAALAVYLYLARHPASLRYLQDWVRSLLGR